MSAAEVAAILMAVAAISSALIAPYLQRRAEAKRIEVTSKEQRESATVGEWRGLYDGVKSENDRLSRRVSHLEEELEELKQEHREDKRRWEEEKHRWEDERGRLYRRIIALETGKRISDDTPPPRHGERGGRNQDHNG